MAYPARSETVGSHMVAVAPVRVGQTAGDALNGLLAARPQAPDLLLVCDDAGVLAGVVPLARLITLEPDTPLARVLDAGFPRVGPETDQETAASLALHHCVDALPVVDAAGRPLGVMPSQALLQVLRREHVEDLHLLAGIHREVAQARHAIEDPPLRRARHRLPWLLVGLLGSGLATLAMAAFERTLEAQIAVAFFVPGIVYLADAIGTQSEAIAVRGLSLTRAGIGHLLAGEMRTGLLIGTALALVAWPLVWFAFGDARLAVAVAFAIFAAGGVASLIGFALPWALARLDVDPAYGSGPVATICQDILSLMVYLGVVNLVGV
jgi:magnesium transporter